MFLTKFDKKMYEEAIRDEGREIGRAEGREETLAKHLDIQRNQAKRLKEMGFLFEDARKIMIEFDEEKLREIFEKDL